MPRRNINAQERIDKRWSDEYIRSLMRKLRAGTLEEAHENDAPIVIDTHNNKKKNK